MTIERTPQGVLDFWLGPLTGIEATTEQAWRDRMLRWRVGVFARAHEDPQFTAAQREVSEALHREGHDGFFSPKELWDTPRGWLARLIVLDQFGRGVYRGTPLAYENDELTVPMLRHICAQGWDTNEYDLIERLWVYVPLSHPEDRQLQELSVTKWTRWSADLIEASSPETRRVNQHVSWNFIKAVIEHSEAVLLHGQFPHRNPILCRPHRAGEIHYLTSEMRPLWSFTQPPRPDFYALHSALHSIRPDVDCRRIDRAELDAFVSALGGRNDDVSDVFDVIGTERVAFRDLYRHLTLTEKSEALARLVASPALARHTKLVTHAIFKDETAHWPPTRPKTSVPRVIDVPALNLAIGCPLLGGGDVYIPRSAIDAFEETTGFRARPFGDLYGRYLEIVRSTAASYERTRDGVRRSVPIDRAGFHSLAQDLFDDTPARDQVLSTLYRLLDMDYDGTVDAGEVLVALLALCKGAVDDKLHVCFSVFDADASGRLDNDELRDLIHTTLLRGLHLVEALFRDYVPEGARESIDVVVLFSLADFAAIENAANQALVEADTDGDGSVDEAEFKAWAVNHPLLRQLFTMSEKLFGP